MEIASDAPAFSLDLPSYPAASAESLYLGRETALDPGQAMVMPDQAALDGPKNIAPVSRTLTQFKTKPGAPGEIQNREATSRQSQERKSQAAATFAAKRRSRPIAEPQNPPSPVARQDKEALRILFSAGERLGVGAQTLSPRGWGSP